MQNNTEDFQIKADDSQSVIPEKKQSKVRKWREIETLQARKQLEKDLLDIDPSFKLSVADFF